MTFIDLLDCIDSEQEITVGITAENGMDVEFKIAGDKASVRYMSCGKVLTMDVASVSCRDYRLVVWLKDLD